MNDNRGIKIDTSKLNKAIADRGLTLTEASRKIYRADTFMGQVMARGCCPKSVLKALEDQLGIRYEDIEPTTEPVEEPEETITEKAESQSGVLYFDMLERAIYRAVRDAIIDANRRGGMKC